MGLIITAQPTAEPVTVNDVKLFGNIIDDNSWDQQITPLIPAARAWVEQYLRRQLMPATFQMTMDRFPYLTVLDPMNQANPKFDNANYYYGSPERFAIWVPRPPLQSITSIVYYDTTSTTQTLSTSSYVVDAVSEPGRIMPVYGAFWPGTLIRPNAVTITFQAGYASAAAIPQPIKFAIIRLVNLWFNETGQNESTDVPLGIRSLLYPYRNLDERVLEYA